MKIRFSKNWNNKLDCPFFTTIRAEPKNVGMRYSIEMDGKHLFNAEAISCTPITIQEILDSPTVSYIDAGLSPEALVNMFRKMYGEMPSNRVMYLILLKKEETNLFNHL